MRAGGGGDLGTEIKRETNGGEREVREGVGEGAREAVWAEPRGGATPWVWMPTTPPTNRRPKAPWGGAWEGGFWEGRRGGGGEPTLLRGLRNSGVGLCNNDEEEKQRTFSLLFFFVMNFMATMCPVYFRRALYTFPNEPSPMSSRTW